MGAERVEPELVPEVSTTLETGQPEDPGTTWDGKPISRELPHGSTVVVFRKMGGAFQVLLLHRAHNGPEYEGDWAWTPPSGARFPGEPVLDAARRDLREEAGLALEIAPEQCGNERWHVYVAEAPLDAHVTIEHDPEHDRFGWFSPEEALARCKPEAVRDGLAAAFRVIRRRFGPATSLQERAGQ